MATARDIIKAALRKIAVLGVGSQLSSDEANDGLSLLNNMLSVFSIDGTMIYAETSETFPIVNGTKSYTMGSGGDFDTVRPIDIKTAFVTINSTDHHLKKYSRIEYDSLYQKGVTGIPDRYYYDSNYPLGTITLFPVPNDTTSITLGTEKPLVAFSTLDTLFSMPAEYEAMIVHNLAVWLAPEYEREASPTIKNIANLTYKAIQAQNSKNDKYLSNASVSSRNRSGGVDRAAFIGGV